MPSYRLLRTMKIEQLLQFSSNVIDLAPILPNARITLFPYSNIQGNVTIIFYGTNDKNWNSDLLKSYALIPVINTVNYLVDFYTLFILLLF